MIRHLFSRKSIVDVTPMWFLQKDRSIETSSLPDKIKTVLLSIRENGIALLPANFSRDCCDAVIRDFTDYCSLHPESADYRDEYSLHERLACLHLVSPAARRIVFDDRVIEVVRAAFGKEPVAVGSLYFEKGSTQSIHRDTPAFFTNPLNHYLGVWTALEDVKPGSGPLVYYLKGHRVADDVALYRDPSISQEEYFRTVTAACKRAGLELVEFYPKKGETLIWHPQLPHGGAPISQPGMSRRSIVAHYIPRGIPIYGADAFFGRKPVSVRPNYKLIKLDRRLMIDQGQPRFFHNRYEGNFDEA